jgi:hypothetical protein
LVQNIADNYASVLRITIDELMIERLDPLQKCFVRRRSGVYDTVFISRHLCLASSGKK